MLFPIIFPDTSKGNITFEGLEATDKCHAGEADVTAKCSLISAASPAAIPVASTSQHSPALEVTGNTEAPPLIFTCVDEEWQTVHAAHFGLRVRKKLLPAARLPVHYEEEPENTVSTRGDGIASFELCHTF